MSAPSYFDYMAIKTGAQNAPEPKKDNRAYPEFTFPNWRCEDTKERLFTGK